PKRVDFGGEAGAHVFPSFSPDGQQVAYSAHTASTDDTFHIYVRPSAGGPPRQLTNGEAADIAPVWSPDGSQLAFLRTDEEAARVMVMPSAGGDPREVAQFAPPDEDVQPTPSVSWLRDGKRLVAAGVKDDQPSALFLIDLQGGAAKQITTPAKGTVGDSTPAVSPDGNSIAFV